MNSFRALLQNMIGKFEEMHGKHQSACLVDCPISSLGNEAKILSHSVQSVPVKQRYE
jgi:hypothetical protein